MNKKMKIRLIDYTLPVSFGIIILIVSLTNIDQLVNNFTKIKHENKDKNTSIKNTLQDLEKKYTDNFIGKNNYIDLNGGFASLMNQSKLNNVVKMENGYLVEGIRKIDATNRVESISSFKKHLDSKDIPFLVAPLPHKYFDDNDKQFPSWVQTNANYNIDELVKGLEKEGVSILNMRDRMIEEGLDSYESFYRTDHHWKIETGFWASKQYLYEIQDILKGDFDLDNEKLLESNYEFRVYEDLFLGSIGSRTGVLFGGGDDITSIIPKFDTDLRVEIPSKKFNSRGTFEEVIIDRRKVMDYDKKYQTYMYGRITLDSSDEYLKITNYKAQNDKKIFMINDSFALSTAPFIALNCAEVHLYDMRYGEASPERLLEKIEEVNPDIVIHTNYTSDDKSYDLMPK